MCYKFLIFLVCFLVYRSGSAQVTNSGLMDTLSGTNVSKLTIGGYIDAYYGTNFGNANNTTIPYFVSMNSNNSGTINLAYLDMRYNTDHFRARIVPGFGTYMNANYAAEPGSLGNIVEASAGFKLTKNKNIWIDAGILGSPYTNESAISKDHLMYTRSFAPEYVPYYLSGIKLSWQLHSKVNAYLYLINGWQQIQDVNKGKSVGTQIEYRPNNHHLINWNTYVGDERSALSPDSRMRYFSDIYWIFSKHRFSATSCVYIGNQTKTKSPFHSKNNIWWQANIIGKYDFTSKFSLSARFEYFNDDNAIQITPITPVSGFRSYSTGGCINYKINDNALIRLEGRYFFSDDGIYLDNESTPTNHKTWVVSNMTVWF